MEVTKKDWKLFREKIGGWQEAYMERLNREYVEILSGDKAASEKFWELDKRIRADKRSPGVQLELRKRSVPMDLITLVSTGVISLNDLDGFSEDLRDTVTHFAREYVPESIER